MKMFFVALVAIFIVAPASSQTECPNSWIHDDCAYCKSSNDPHIRTFDGINYDQHTEACFKYVSGCPNEGNQTLPIEICGCHYPCNGVNAYPQCIGDVHITFFQGAIPAYEVYIDYLNPTVPAVADVAGVVVSLTSGGIYFFDGVAYFLYTLTGTVHTFEVFSAILPVPYYAFISYSPGFLQIYLNDNFWKWKTCGLCGYYTGLTDDDFLGSDGVTYLTAAEIAAISWPQSAATNALINPFAATWLCNGSEIISNGTSVVTRECFVKARACCERLWAWIRAYLYWCNWLLDLLGWLEKWLNDCAIDACAMTNNNPACYGAVTQFGTEFDFAKEIAERSAECPQVREDKCETFGKTLWKPHDCQCQVEPCDGLFCNTLEFVMDRLGYSYKAIASAQRQVDCEGYCCCSCPNCEGYVKYVY